MNNGTIQQFGNPEEVYDSSSNIFVAGFMNPSTNFRKGIIIGKNGNLYFQCEDLKLSIAEEMYGKLQEYKDREVVFAIRPEDLYDSLFDKKYATKGNTKSGKIVISEPHGNGYGVFVSFGEKAVDIQHSWKADIDRRGDPRLYRAGEELRIVFDIKKFKFFDPQTGNNILPKQSDQQSYSVQPLLESMVAK